MISTQIETQMNKMNISIENAINARQAQTTYRLRIILFY